MMLDDTSARDEDDGVDRPTWEIIEATMRLQIERVLEYSNGMVIHGKHCFESSATDMMNIGMLAGNQSMMLTIDRIIKDLQDLDATDIFFNRFIKRLRLRRRNYEAI